METKDILVFKNKIANFSLEELETALQETQAELSRMILNSDAILKAAILETAIEERKAEANGEAK